MTRILSFWFSYSQPSPPDFKNKIRFNFLLSEGAASTKLSTNEALTLVAGKQPCQRPDLEAAGPAAEEGTGCVAHPTHSAALCSRGKGKKKIKKSPRTPARTSPHLNPHKTCSHRALRRAQHLKTTAQTPQEPWHEAASPQRPHSALRSPRPGPSGLKERPRGLGGRRLTWLQ